MCSKEEQPKTVEAASEIPRQSVQEQPGLQHGLKPQPVVHHLPTETDSSLHPYMAAGKLEGKVALITGGDSGIGRSVATLFSMEGCKGIGIVYLEREDQVGCANEKKNKHDAIVCAMQRSLRVDCV